MHDGDATWNEARAELAAASASAAAAEAAELGAAGVASRLAPLLTRLMPAEGREAADELPIRVRAWDGSAIGPATAPAFVIRHRRALRRLLWKPGELGFVRAYVAGELDIEGDVFAALEAVQRVLGDGDGPIRLSGDDKRDIVRTAVTLGAVGPEPKAPPEESAPGRRGGGEPGHAGPMREPAAFFARLFGDGLAHGTGRWDRAAGLDTGMDTGMDTGLDRAQSAAHEAVAEELGLFPGARLLDLNCGWGAFARHAAVRHGARVVGLTRTPGQADHVRAIAAGARADVEARGWDLPEAGDGPYDAIVGLADVAPIDRPASRLFDLLAPGGRLVLQQPVRRPGPRPNRRTFTTGYLFQDESEPRPLGVLAGELEDAGLEVRAVEALREHHARTLRAWAAGLQRHWSECAELAGPGRARVWLLYLATSALACENGRIGRHEIRAERRDDGARGDTNRAPGPTGFDG
ncbi:class I SAM-dependent methyltransferase [Actinomadura sp. 7K507]|uniref:class I SAM-dependent methyltransferase n=1 Tax=Actinomadura sp. 7K507 TaxID=2530365 RepID=UPI00104ED8EF|nr:class I SAM-dependent methyltransferase [Actinomadura sp. 7K507]TDC97376.1 SAM-dependent methyltransferase [Actinomadura sp. 7K507]